MSKTIRKYDKFEYHLEDLECCDCLHNKTKGGKKNGCGFSRCRYDGIRAEAAAHNRVKRPKGWNKWPEQ